MATQAITRDDVVENRTGIMPIETKCLVLPDPVEDKIGGILLADETKEKQAWQRQRCTLLAMGAMAFTDDAGRSWPDAPAPGDRVFVAQYAGSKVEVGSETYWIINDTDIIGRLEQ